jgi:hypothetical protein
MFHLDYRLLFSLNKNVPSKITYNDMGVRHNGICEYGDFDIFIENCTIRKQVIDGTSYFYPPEHSHDMDSHDMEASQIKLTAIFSEKLNKESILNSKAFSLIQHSFNETADVSTCARSMANQYIATIRWDQKFQVDKMLCASAKTAHRNFSQVRWDVIAISRYMSVKEVLFTNGDLQLKKTECQVNDKLHLFNANVFDIAGQLTFAVVIDHQTFHFLLNESIFIATWKQHGPVQQTYSLMVLLCKKSGYGMAYLGIFTSICNCTSLLMLSTTISFYLCNKSIRSRLTSATLHLSTSLFFAQFIFQVNLYHANNIMSFVT